MDATLRQFNISTLRQSYNIAVLDEVDMIVASDGFVVRANWGKHPRLQGVQVPHIDAKHIHSKPTFRMAFRTQRCVILIDSYYTWKDKTRKPVRVVCEQGPMLVPAVFYKTLNETYAFTIISTTARSVLQEHSDVEPVLFNMDQSRKWLDFLPVTQVIKLLQDIEQLNLHTHPVSQKIYVKGFDHKSLHIQQQDQILLF